MNSRTITLRADLVDRLEQLARAQGRSMDDVFHDLLEQFSPPVGAPNWALALATAMEDLPLDWLDEPELSARSREHFERYLAQKWQRTQTAETGENE